MHEKTNQVQSFWQEIGNWCRSVFIHIDLSALKINRYNIKQQCWNEKENPKDKISKRQDILSLGFSFSCSRYHFCSRYLAYHFLLLLLVRPVAHCTGYLTSFSLELNDMIVSADSQGTSLFIGHCTASLECAPIWLCHGGPAPKMFSTRVTSFYVIKLSKGL